VHRTTSEQVVDIGGELNPALELVHTRQAPKRESMASVFSRQTTRLETDYGSILKDTAVLIANAFAVYYGDLLAHKAIHLLHWPEIGMAVSRLSLIGLLVSAMVTLLVSAETGLHRKSGMLSRSEDHSGTWRAVCSSTFISVVATVLSGQSTWAASMIVFYGAMNGLTMVAWRRAVRSPISDAARAIAVRRAFIVGANDNGEQVASLLRHHCADAYSVCGAMLLESHADTERLGTVLQQNFVDDVFIALPIDPSLVPIITAIAQDNRADVKLVPELSSLPWHAPLHFIGEFPAFALQTANVPALAMLVKRCIDVVLSAIGLIALSPVLAVIAVAIKLDSKGPALFSAHRVGRKGRTFPFHKFRTMVANAEELKDKLRRLNKRVGPTFKIADDPRITRVGKFLRRTSLDELPQLWNVLRGDMSIVGPRPHPLDDFRRYQPEHMKRLAVLPGITGLWQVKARRDASFETNMNLDLAYIENWSLRLDASILARTIPAVIRGSGE